MAAVRQKFHLARCSNLPSHLSVPLSFFGTSIGMNSSPSFAANLSNDARKGLAILSLSKAEPIAHLADREGVSRQFLYRQKQKAAVASVLHG